ncbi:hypothetical protein AMR42_04930 [Limnothrix sp. PR1529]|nr:hypothetical protein BCR12_08445 [Limnothrix sp. P13C2]PIB14630.1 hypothetical protein AMR42_04930 [Limnothrix sp. PR1529]
MGTPGRGWKRTCDNRDCLADRFTAIAPPSGLVAVRNAEKWLLISLFGSQPSAIALGSIHTGNPYRIHRKSAGGLILP